MPPTIAFLGPEGTFTSEAARSVAPDGAVFEALPTITEVVEAVRAGQVTLGIVPIENSIEGSVNLTLDELAFGPPGPVIRGELAMAISMNLLVRPGSTLEKITTVRSQPHALAQCRKWLTAHLPEAKLEAATSTAEAAREVAASDGSVAALGTRLAAELYGLEVLEGHIHDHGGNTTRFAVLAQSMSPPTGADKTSMVIFLGRDRPGLLMRILDEFALRGINLTKIESRPTKQQLGEYCMFIDAAGHPSQPHMAEALRSVHRHVAELRILGAYPRADGLREAPQAEDSPTAYRRADEWYEALMDRIAETP